MTDKDNGSACGVRRLALTRLSRISGTCLLFLLLSIFFHLPAFSAADKNPRSDENAASEVFGGLPAPDGRQGMDAKGRAQWLEIAPGLDYGEFRLNEEDSKLTALRIDPEQFDFILGASGADGKGTRTLAQWARDHDLMGAINASMYLPSHKSTGYMRYGEHVNNPRIVERFGAFFVARPKRQGLPRAMILDKSKPEWRKTLDDYDLVIQNYRMINQERRILWSPGGPLYSISAIAQDGNGRILFLHSRKPVEAYTFAQQLLHLPLDIRTVMYVEGGAQAGLLVRSSHLNRDLGAPHAPSFLVTGNIKASLPNILGIKTRSGDNEKTLQK